VRIAIHQPNFFPTFAYFQKIIEVDKFIILRYCQFEKNGYQNRFDLDGNWHTMSTNSGLEPISQKKYITHLKDWNKIKINLKEYSNILSKFDKYISSDLDITNSKIIIELCNIMGIKTIIDFDYRTDLKGTERLVDICKTYKATSYLSGESGKKYLDLKKFKVEKIKVDFQKNQNYTPILKKLI
jgi:hypothetical protein